MRIDTKRVIQLYGINDYGAQEMIEAGEAALLRDEQVLLAIPSDIKFKNKRTYRTEFFPGVLFLTDSRVLLYYHIILTPGIDALTADEVCEVRCYSDEITGGHLEIHTRDEEYDLLISHNDKRMIEEIQALFEKTLKRRAT